MTLNNIFIGGFKMELKEIRNFLNLTQKEFAERLKVSQSLVSGIECGSRVLSDRLYYQIAAEFGMNVDFLMTGKGEAYRNVKFNDEFLNAFISAFSRMSDSEKEVFKDFCEKFGIVKKENSESKAI